MNADSLATIVDQYWYFKQPEEKSIIQSMYNIVASPTLYLNTSTI